MATSTLRKLLRAVQRHVRPQGSRAAQPHFRDYVLAEFRRNVGLTDAAAIKQKLSLAEDCATLITNVHYHKDLLRSYNIDVNRSDEVQERLINTAGRVGLAMPEVYDEGKSEEGPEKLQ